ncbi:nup98 [Symbiodinium natans]|uniref:Nup98 protein n=1 Tax=Symbiodinium natans TaxID=878477 RepID=A0A812RDG3_9DINO|nr:nup98 [Symbiodinium natans]
MDLPRVLLAAASAVCLCQAASLSPLYKYAFEAAPFQEVQFTAGASPVVLSGRSPKECSSPLDFSNANVSFVALALTDLGQGCFSSTSYANGDFPVVIGTLQLGTESLEAFEVQPPQASASQFVASGQQLYVRLPDTSEYRLYRLEGGVLFPVAQMKADVADSFVPTGVAVQSLSTAAVFTVLAADRVIPAPTKRTLSGHGVTECAGIFPEAETFGDITLATMESNGGTCWKDLRYSNTNYVLELGELTGTDGTVLESVRISPPSILATDWVASRTQLYIKQSIARSTNIWTYVASSGFRLLETMDANQSYQKTSVRVDDLSEQMLIILQPSSARLSVWPLKATGVEAAWLDGKVDGSFSLTARRFSVPGQPFRPEVNWNHGPGTHTGNYGTYKRFFSVMHADGREGVVWQDFTNEAVKLTWLAADFLSSQTVQLSALSSTIFVGAVGDGTGNVVLLLGAAGSPTDKTATSSAEVVKYDAAGNEVLRAALPSGKSDLNIYAFSSSGASLAWDTGSGTIAVSLARTMTKASDGLNHQGGIAFVLDASTLQIISNYGQTSGHSFANSLKVSQKAGWYIGKDLGDNYPRGINLWELKATSKSWQKRLVYKFKTKHGTSETSPAGATYPVYSEISTSGQTYYKWSNDNYIYTELAHPGLHEVNDTILVFFTGEAPPLDNGVVGQALNVARNVGFVKIPRDLSSDAVLSPGAEETGGFYTFGGGWSTQTNRGISFLTSKTDVAESVSRLKTAELGGAILLIWEVWSRTAYNRSECMIVDTDGAVLQSETLLTYPLQLPFADDVMVIDGKMVAYVGSPEQQLVRLEFCYQGCDAPLSLGTTSTVNPTGSSGNPGDSSSSGGELARLSMALFLLLAGLAAVKDTSGLPML